MTASAGAFGMARVVAASFAAGVTATAGLLWLRALRRGRRPVRVGMPHPRWVPGEKQPPPFDADAMHVVDPSAVPSAELYPLCISAVVPRPIGFVASLSSSGQANLAPYSYFNLLSHSPPVVALGICRSPGRGGGKKDTLQNIEDVK
jgi:hypothetical protein